MTPVLNEKEFEVLENPVNCRSRRLLLKFALISTVALSSAVVLFLGLSARSEAHSNLQRELNERALPAVRVIPAQESSAEVAINLPGTIRADQATDIRARATGYVKGWNADIGQLVKKGELLAELNTPELDQETEQARARHSQAKSKLDLARITLERLRKLSDERVISEQARDEAQGAFDSADSELAAARANVQRLEELQQFKRIVAPFTGRITTRTVEMGDLVTTGAANSQLFRLVQTNPLRIYMDVPQSYLRSVTIGMNAKIAVREFPEKVFTGKIARTSGAIDPVTRTLRVEVELPNDTNELLPGMYAEIKFTGKAPHRQLRVPSNVVMFKTAGPQLAVINQNDTVEIRRIKLGRDFGTELEVIDGIKPEERIVLNPTDELENGARVRVAPTASPKES